jgi:hypothetical protein
LTLVVYLESLDPDLEFFDRSSRRLLLLTSFSLQLLGFMPSLVKPGLVHLL